MVGAGFAGAVSARVLAEAGHTVEVLEQRPHVGGNAFDRVDRHGVLIHEYGPHVLHTDSSRVWRFLSRFTDWRAYEHRVRSVPDARQAREYPIPVNRTTLNLLLGLGLDDAGAAAFFASLAQTQARAQADDPPQEPTPDITLGLAPDTHRPPRNAEEAMLATVGRELYETFFRGFARKQWGCEPTALAADIAARIETRCDDDDRCYRERHQALPAAGYTALFRRLLDHPSIAVRLGARFDFDRRNADQLIFTGPIDQYYGYRFGRLPYRSLQFEHEHFADRERFQTVGTINYPNDHAHTRVTEFKHLTGQRCRGTSIVREVPGAEGEPHLPLRSPESVALHARYQALANAETDVHFVGRLARFEYLDMDEVVEAALDLGERLAARLQPQESGAEVGSAAVTSSVNTKG